MISEPLLHDLALILVVAGLTTIIFRALKQPLVLGYIVAGFITGPNFEYLPDVVRIESIKFWGDLGVIFLLFGLGMEFSFKKLKKVGGTGFIAVVTETIIMFSVGYLAGRAFGWNWMNSVFLGGMLTISSTSIIIKAFEDLGLKNKKFAGLVFGVLVVEDLVAVLQLVVLSALAVTSTFDGTIVFGKMAYLALFLLFWFTGGVYFIPSLLRRVRRWVNDEILIVFSLGLCLGMVVITEMAGFSAALGAFIMGSILAECEDSERIMKLIKPVRDFFGAIFFLSVGMLVDPAILADYWKPVLFISAIVVFVKSGAVTSGLLLAGNTIKTSMKSGFCMCQIGEFSFIIASLGLSLNVIEPSLYPVIVSVSIITTFVTPYYIRAAEPVYESIYKNVPSGWKVVMERLGTGRKTLDRESEWNQLMRSYVTRVFIFGGWLVLVFILFTKILNPFILSLTRDFTFDSYLFASLTLTGMSPFLFALIRRKDSAGLFDKIWNDSRFSRGPLLAMLGFKYLLGALFVALAISYYLRIGYGVLFIVVVITIISIYLSQTIKKYYSHLETNFIKNLHVKPVRKEFVVPKTLADEIHIESIEVEPGTVVAGKTISQIHRESRTGAQIVQIKRGSRYIDLPVKTEIILPHDQLLILGNDVEISTFRDLNSATAECISTSHQDMDLYHFVVCKNSLLIGVEANISDFRNRFDLLLIGIEKGEQGDFARPHSSIIIEEGDTLWVVGNKLKANEISKGNR